MKKIFTLACMALFAMSVNAQTTTKKVKFDVESEEGQSLINAANKYADNPTPNTSGATWVVYPEEFIKKTTDALKVIYTNENGYTFETGIYDACNESGDWSKIKENEHALPMNDAAFTYKSAAVDLTAVACPNLADIVSGDKIWQKWFNATSNMELKADGYPEFTVAWRAKNINAHTSYIGFYEDNFDIFGDKEEKYNKRAYKEKTGEMWTPDMGIAPAKGNYYKFNVHIPGKLVFGFYVNNGGRAIYVYDGKANALVPNDKIKLAYYENNNEGNLIEKTMPEGNVLSTAKTIGYLTIEAEAGDEYYILGNTTQVGIYGFEYTYEDDGTGISEIATANDDNAPVYNLAGQKVGNDYKGIVIKNGKKFVNK